MAKRVQLHITDSRDRREGHVEGVEPRIAFYQHETDCAYRQRDPEQPGDENDTANQTAGHRSIPTKMSRCDCFPVHLSETGHHYSYRSGTSFSSAAAPLSRPVRSVKLYLRKFIASA